MKYCYTCGKNVGFSNRDVKCTICDKGICSTCHRFSIIEFENASSSYNCVECNKYTCSDRCALEYTKRFIGRMRKDRPAHLLISGNLSIQVSEVTRDNQISMLIADNALTKEMKKQDSMPKELQSIYDFIKTEFNNKKIDFEEEHEDDIKVL